MAVTKAVIYRASVVGKLLSIALKCKRAAGVSCTVNGGASRAKQLSPVNG